MSALHVYIQCLVTDVGNSGKQKTTRTTCMDVVQWHLDVVWSKHQMSDDDNRGGLTNGKHLCLVSIVFAFHGITGGGGLWLFAVYKCTYLLTVRWSSDSHCAAGQYMDWYTMLWSCLWKWIRSSLTAVHSVSKSKFKSEFVVLCVLLFSKSFTRISGWQCYFSTSCEIWQDVTCGNWQAY